MTVRVEALTAACTVRYYSTVYGTVSIQSSRPVAHPHSISILFQAPECKILMWSLVFQIVTPPTTRPLVANDGFSDSAQGFYA